MALTKDDFLRKYPEFNGTPPGLVESRLAISQARVDEEAFGALYEHAVYTYTAHLISTSPNGVAARLNKTDSETIYSAEWNRIRLLHGRRGLPY